MAEDLITVPLAHELPQNEAVRLGAVPPRAYKPGEDVVVPRRSAEMLYGAAQLQGHPRNAEDRDRLLGSGAQIVPAETQKAPAVVASKARPAAPAPAAVTPPPAA